MIKELLTNENLLLKDLFARLPYNVKVQYKNNICSIDTYTEDNKFLLIDEKKNEYPSINDKLFLGIEEFKPYLFPISSMTMEQCLKLFDILGVGVNSNYGGDYVKINDTTGITFFFETGRDIGTVMKAIDYLNSIHVDYRELIPKGLANDATDLNIY